MENENQTETAPEAEEVKTDESVQPEGDKPEETQEGEITPAGEGEENPPPEDAPSLEPGENETPGEESHPDEGDGARPDDHDPTSSTHESEVRETVMGEPPKNDTEATDLALHLIHLLAELKRREPGGTKTVRIVNKLKKEIAGFSALILLWGIKREA